MSLSPPYQRVTAAPQIPEPVVTYFAIKIQSLTGKVSLIPRKELQKCVKN